MANAEQGPEGTAQPRKTSTERGKVWRSKNRAYYNEYMRQYNQTTGKVRESHKRRYHKNIEEARRQARDRQRRHRQKQKQQSIDIFSKQEGDEN